MAAHPLDFPYSRLGWLPLPLPEGPDVCKYGAHACPVEPNVPDVFVNVITVPDIPQAPSKAWFCTRGKHCRYTSTGCTYIYSRNKIARYIATKLSTIHCALPVAERPDTGEPDCVNGRRAIQIGDLHQLQRHSGALVSNYDFLQ